MPARAHAAIPVRKLCNVGLAKALPRTDALRSPRRFKTACARPRRGGGSANDASRDLSSGGAGVCGRAGA